MGLKWHFRPHTEAVWPPKPALPMQYRSIVRVRCRVSAGLHPFAGQACHMRWSPHDPTFFGESARDCKVAESTFSAQTDNTSNPAANILHRTPFPAAWRPWVPPTGVEAALSSMSGSGNFIAIKSNFIAIKCDELPLSFPAAYRGSLATKGGVTDAASFPRAGKVSSLGRSSCLRRAGLSQEVGGRCDERRQKLKSSIIISAYRMANLDRMAIKETDAILRKMRFKLSWASWVARLRGLAGWAGE